MLQTKLFIKLSLAAKAALLFLVLIYKNTAAVFFGGQCRYYPSCSNYAIEALKEHSIFRAILLTLFRISRCHPFGGFGHDPVPTKTRSL